MQIAQLAEKFQVEKLEERTEFYKSHVIIKVYDWSVDWEFATKAATGGGKDPVMPDLTVIEGVKRIGVDSYQFTGTDVLGKALSISVEPVK